jgi:uncharacterized protein YacL (UPF0231 family)
MWSLPRSSFSAAHPNQAQLLLRDSADASRIRRSTHTPTVQVGISVGGAFESWEDYVRAVHQKSQLEKEVKKKKVELKKVEKQIQAAQKKEPTEGILAKLLTLELKKDEIKVEVHAKQSDLISLQWIIESQEIDDDDEEVMFLGS